MLLKAVVVGTLMLVSVVLGQNGTNKDEEAIQRVIDRFMAAWNGHDARAFAGVFSGDADVTNWVGKGVSGRANVEQSMAPLFATAFRNSHQESTSVKVRFVRPDVAAVDVRWTLTGVLEKAGSPRPDRNGLLSFVMAKNGGGWEIVVMHNLDISALPPPPSK